MWERRWGVLWRRLDVDTEFATDVINATMLLHNLCVERRVPPCPDDPNCVPLQRGEGLNGRPAARRDEETLRQRITRAIQAMGLRRGPLPAGLWAPQAVDGVA